MFLVFVIYKHQTRDVKNWKMWIWSNQID